MSRDARPCLRMTSGKLGAPGAIKIDLAQETDSATIDSHIVRLTTASIRTCVTLIPEEIQALLIEEEQ